MAKKAETVFRNRIRPLLRALPNTIIFGIQQVAIRGVPDYLLCINGLFVALELKKDFKSKPSPLQEYTLEQIEKSNGISFVVYPENWNNIYSRLKHLSEKHHVQIEIRGHQKP